MPTKQLPTIGDFAVINRFSYTNPYGGTGVSNGQYDAKLLTKQTVKVIYSFYDDEVGERYFGIAVSQELIDYLNKHGHPKDRRVFFSEHDVVKVEDVVSFRSGRNSFYDTTNTIDAKMKAKILRLARKEFPHTVVDITVMYKKFYFIDQPGYTQKKVVSITPRDPARDPIYVSEE